MAYSRQDAVSDGTLQVLDISIKYMRREDIVVLLDGVETDDWDWVGLLNSITFPAVLPIGTAVTVVRRTRQDKVTHEFAKGAQFTSTTMDADFRQMLYLAQEYTEGAGVKDFFNDLDMHGFRVRNVADGTSPGDAVNLRQLQDASFNAPVLAQEALSKADAALALLAKDFRVSKYASLQAGIDAVEAAGGGTLWIDKPISSGPIVMDPTKVTIHGTHGTVATIDFSATPATPLSHDFMVRWRNHVKVVGRKEPFRAVTLIGPAAAAKWHCFPVFSVNVDGMTNYAFIGVNIIDFAIQMYYGPQSSNVSWIGCQFSQSDANFHTSTSIYAGTLYGTANGGECWSYSNCQFNNVADVALSDTGIAGGWSFSQCALVYFRRCITLNQPAKVSIGTGCHVESGFYEAPWFTTRGNGCIIRATNTEVWMAGTVSNYIFSSGSSTTFGGIFLDQCDYHADAATIDRWADPTRSGDIHAPGWRAQDSQVRLPFGRHAGVDVEPWLTSDPGWAQAFKPTNADDRAVLTQDPGQSHGGIGSTVMTTTAVGEQIIRSKRWPVRGGDIINSFIWVKTFGFAAAGAGVGMFVYLLDSDGNSIGAGGNPWTLEPGQEQSEWTKVDLSWYPTVFKGAAFYELRVYANPAVNAGARRLFLADHLINTQ